MFNKGFLYRLGVSIREIGETSGHNQFIFAGIIIKAGLFIRDFAAEITYV